MAQAPDSPLWRMWDADQWDHMLRAAGFSVDDFVRFLHRGAERTGRITRKTWRRAWVKVSSGETLKIPWKKLHKCGPSQPAADRGHATTEPPGPEKTGVITQFRVGSEIRTGAILRRGPKRALVFADDGKQYRVPYSLLKPASPVAEESFAGGKRPTETEKKSNRSTLSIGDPVQFRRRGRVITGHLTRKNSKDGLVTTEAGLEYKVHWGLLERHEGGKPRVVTDRLESIKAAFRPNDRVQFKTKSGVLSGEIARHGPKRAFIVTDSGEEWRVPYSQLELLSRSDGRDDERVLSETRKLAGELMARHGLSQWSFQFDDASRRAGVCKHATKVLSLAREFALVAPSSEVRNTILHEIAHALVGPKHNHDQVWKDQARAIGCTGERCHDVKFAPPRYIKSCPQCGWYATGNQQKRSWVCGQCRTPIKYQTYTKRAWEAVAHLAYSRN